MRRIVTGTDNDGRSCVLEFGDAPVAHRFEGAHGTEAVVRDLWSTEPPRALEDWPAGLTPSGFDVRCPPGATRWMVVEWAPGRAVALHSTDTVDYDLVLSGELTLVLETEEVALRAGDAVILPGVVHGWRTDAQGCVLAVTLVGASRLD